MATSWDLFFSYRRHDQDRARPLLNALAEAGVRVWRDENNIPDQESITVEIRNGIANSKAFLAFYSRTYPASNPCQQEITIAWLAAQQIDHIANRRVWIVNPEHTLEHIPDLLRDQQIPLVNEGGSQFAAIAKRLKDRLDALDATALVSGVRGLPAYRGMSPIQARRFVGRTVEMWDLHAKLTANRTSIISGVYGQTAAHVRALGGNGKSLLAREYSIRFGPAYPGGVFWLNAYGHDDVKGSINAEQREALRQDQIREFAIRSGVPTEGLKPGEIESGLWQAIERWGERCLWIVDDVPSGLGAGELESVWYARWTGASTLVTTRSKEYGTLGAALNLGVLAPREAFELLCSHRQPVSSAEESAAYRIVDDLLGCHPLAVEVAGSYLAQGVEGFESYVDALMRPHEDALEFGKLLKESLPTGHERSISATLLKSIRQLDQEGLDFLLLASLLAVAPIQLNFLMEVFELLKGTGKTHSLKAVNQAGALSLCEPSGDNARTVHTLVSRAMRFKYPADQETAQIRQVAVQALIQRLKDGHDLRKRPEFALDLPHARHLVTTGLQSEQEATLALAVARYYYADGDLTEARELQEQVFATNQRLLGHAHPETATAALDLAQSLYLAGELGKAQHLQEYSVETNHRLLGHEHQNTLAAKLGLAQTLYGQGHLAEARDLQEQVLIVRERLLGSEHPSTLTTMNNLALTLSAQGNLGRARELHERVLAARRKTLGDEHPNTLTSMSNLAQTLKTHGDLDRAKMLEETVLSGRQSLPGAEHPDTLRAMHNLATTFCEKGSFSEAQTRLEDVLEKMRRVLGGEHPETLSAIGSLAEVRDRQGDLIGASRCRQEILNASTHSLGEEHPDTLFAATNFAATLYALGNLAEARSLQEKVLSINRRRLGEDDPKTLLAKKFLLGILCKEGDSHGAKELAEQVLASYCRVLGREHQQTAAARGELARILSKLNRVPPL